ncbi:hypothetical protein [Paenibacillus sp. Soil750]|uniref:hypothetical protein n=1 Tax=Paenibacillus sp. Soil750 TaxID=1736398 RepID=UPI0006F72CDF|nr:hypothetical protein [Paenibacillus sp. Soil750]KRE70866.1 hypothetical protein ASL11_11270 [Paenibacillus sp. Soil750]
MPYKIAYGVDRSHLNSSNLIDKFIVATMNNDEEALKQIIASINTKQSKSTTQENQPFAHLKKGENK